MSVLKAYFLSRHLREKILLLGFLLMAVAVWASSYADRLHLFMGRFSTTKSELREQALWLSRREQIELDAKRAISRLDPSSTLDGTKLLAEVNRIAGEVGLGSNVQADDTKDERSSQFAVHSLRFTVRRADYPTLVKFYLALQKRSPYIGIEQFSLQSEPNNPAMLTALFRITSVEVLR
jgi:hypothetical protein